MTVEEFVFPCSFAQRRLWFLDRLNPGGCEYNIAAAIRLEDGIDETVLERSITELVRRHESLRTTFAAVDGEPMQVVASNLRLPITVRSLEGPAESARQEAFRLAEAEALTPFDLACGPLLRVGVLHLDRREAVLLVTTHHIVSDGWSMDLLFRELTTLYAAFAAGRPSPLPDLPIQYADYAVWQHEPLQQRGIEEHLAYWRRQLAGAPVLQPLLTDFRRPVVSSFRGGREPVAFDSVLTARLQALSREEGVTLFMTLLACFSVVISRYSGQHDILIGTLNAGRDRLETEGVIGFFVNTLPLRVDLSGNPTVSEVLARVKQTALDAYAHADVPFERLVEALAPERDLSRNPLVQITFQLFNLPGAAHARTEASAEMIDVQKRTAKFDLALEMWEEEGELRGRMEYSTDLFEASTIRRMLRHFETLARAATTDPAEGIETLQLLTPAEADQQIYEWNRTHCDDPADFCAHELFEHQVHRTPQATAVIDGRRRWTYEELNRRADTIALQLREVGVTTEHLVGICMRRSADMVAALIAVWKAGGAYVPLDPSYPADRLAFIASDAGVRSIVSDGSGPVFPKATIVPVPGSVRSAVEDKPTPRSCASHRLAYVLYTSGSTGRPKGVAIEHRNTTTLIEWGVNAYSAHQLSGVLASTSISFDLSVFELFVPLCSGGAVILAESALHLASLPAADHVTLINTVPSAMAELVRAGDVPRGVGVVNLAGEPLHASLVDAIFESTDVEWIFNLYGPTEDTTYSTGAAIHRGERWNPTIGRPLPNRQAYILDSRLQPVPIGVSGELYLGGGGVARGYWNQPEWTSERFVRSPFLPNARVYKTGDLARYRAMGEIELLGRADTQVKLRGFRIELGEIESTLRQHADVSDATVVLRDDHAGEPCLIAYVVPARPAASPASILRDLQLTLPHYMIPSAVLCVHDLPRTPNGKVDRLQLLAPAAAPSSGRARTDMERTIAAVWQDVLGLPSVGVTSTFFELGGHSLLLLRLQSKLRDVIGEVPLLDFFRFPTIQALAAHLSSQSADLSSGTGAAQRRAAQQRAHHQHHAFRRRGR